MLSTLLFYLRLFKNKRMKCTKQVFYILSGIGERFGLKDKKG